MGRRGYLFSGARIWDPMPLTFERLRFGLSRLFAGALAVFFNQGGADPIEQLFESAAVFEGLADNGNQGQWDIKAATAPALGEGEYPGRVFVPPSAGRAIFSDAGLIDFSQ